MIQFYVPDIAESLTLPETESGHCVRVLRKGVGDCIYCVDGCGTRYTCVITEAHQKHVRVRIQEARQAGNHWPCEITLIFAPTKNMDRMEWMTEKCTEIGVNRLIPVRCSHSERKEIKTARLEKILVSAMKQSLKGVLPDLREMTPVEDVLKTGFDGQKFICYCSDEVERRLLMKEYIPGGNVMILIGPEGDFSPEEVRLAIDCGWIPVSLGESRLRTETAGVVAVSAIHTINQLTS